MATFLVLGLISLVHLGQRRVARLDAKRYRVTPVHLAIPEDPQSIERGRYLAQAVLGCGACHGHDMAGAVFLDVPGFARIAGANLTPSAGARVGDYDDADWLRAIRHGVGPDGRPLWFMGGGPVALVAPEDLAALIAYLRSLAPIERELPPSRVRWLGAIAVLQGELDLTHAQHVDHEAPLAPAHPAPGPTLEYGRYLADIGGCSDCHRRNFGGGPYPGAPPWFPLVTNLTPTGMGETWSRDQFDTAVRSGRGLDGHVLHELMPWTVYANMSDGDINALWLYLSSLPAAPTDSVPFDPYRLPEQPNEQ